MVMDLEPIILFASPPRPISHAPWNRSNKMASIALNKSARHSSIVHTFYPPIKSSLNMWNQLKHNYRTPPNSIDDHNEQYLNLPIEYTNIPEILNENDDYKQHRNKSETIESLSQFDSDI